MPTENPSFFKKNQDLRMKFFPEVIKIDAPNLVKLK